MWSNMAGQDSPFFCMLVCCGVFVWLVGWFLFWCVFLLFCFVFALIFKSLEVESGF